MCAQHSCLFSSVCVLMQQRKIPLPYLNCSATKILSFIPNPFPSNIIPIFGEIRERLQKKKQRIMEEEVGRAFVNHYYKLFDTDRSSLVSLYQPTSLLTFEGQTIQGAESISGKLYQLPFDQCRHVISTIDSQPSAFAGGVIVFVSGSLQLAGEDHPLRFSQMFHLIPTEEGCYFVQNDIFRLNYG